MNRYPEIYEETNYRDEDDSPEEKYGYYPEYHLVKKFYPDQNPSFGYEKVRNITRDLPPQNNAYKRRERVYNYYTETNLPYNENKPNIQNRRLNTPDRIKNTYNNFTETSNYNIRDQYDNPNNRVNIRQNVYKGSHTPNTYCTNNCINMDPNEEYIDNYQYHETKNIKDKGAKKYESITHITGYSNLIPLHRMKNIYGNNYNREQDMQREEERIRQEKLMQERIRREELRKERLRQEREDRIKEEKRKERLREERLKQEKLRIENEKALKSNKYNRIPNKKNMNNKYLNNKKNNVNSTSYRKKITKTRTVSNLSNDNIRMNNINKRKNNRSFQENNKYIINKSSQSSRDYTSNPNSIKIQQKAAILNFPNLNKKINTYGEHFDNEKYKREYINVERVNNGRIENHIETGLSKDGQYLISQTFAQKYYDENYNGNENEYENEEMEEEEEIYEDENEEGDNNKDELPEKNVEEIISTVTTKKRNLGDNYRFYESKNLNKPNITSFTKHRRRTERTIYGNEEYKTREVKRYKIKPQINEYGETTQQIIETSKIPYDEEEEYIGEEGNDEGEGQEHEVYENEEEEE